jgi:hypothetical protein
VAEALGSSTGFRIEPPHAVRGYRARFPGDETRRPRENLQPYPLTNPSRAVTKFGKDRAQHRQETELATRRWIQATSLRICGPERYHQDDHYEPCR